MQDPIKIAADEILRIKVNECGEPLIDLKSQDIIQFGPPPEMPITKNDYTKLRKSVYEKLCLAQKDLPNHWRFRVYECYRSIKVQGILFDSECQRVKSQQLNLNDEEIFYEAMKLISPVINLDGSKNLPPHNTGAAVDVEVIDKNGELVDMGMAIKDWQDVALELCATNYAELSDEARRNRQSLFDVMQKQGFINYPTEWWHYSYGDRYWAYFSKAPVALYGSVDAL